ncbi:DUF6884 domain-containing protein [Streptomyces sp. 1222.5]|uniref:DUF6884 domain-containing protein n=1 Tax=Streptomyces sp. 1222.5 TaxID=1881026 RepID=UPI003EB83CA9
MTETKTLRVPAQLRKHVSRNVKPKTQGERELLAACDAGARELERQGRNNMNSIDLELTNEALGAVLKLARGWLDSDNGNNVMAAKSMLKFELEYEPDDPREIRHEVKFPKSVAGLFPSLYEMKRDNSKGIPKAVKAELSQMSWATAGTSGRVTNATLGWLLDYLKKQWDHPTPSVQRAARKFIGTYTQQYEQTQRLINGYLGTGEDEDQAPEVERKRLVIIACGGKKSERPGKIPADERYIGNYFTACLMAAEVMDGPTMILSAKYGLIPLTEEIENYDVKMGDPEAVSISMVQVQAANIGLLDAKVTVLGGEKYVKAVRQVWPDAEAPLVGGIGQQLKQLAGMYEGEALDDDERQDQEPEEKPVRQWEKRRMSDFVSWSGERRFFYFGGLAKHPVNENGLLVGLKWSESESGTNYLKDPETGQVIAEVHSMSNVWAIPAEAPEGFVEYEDRGKPADELYWPEEYSRGEFRNIPNLPSRGRSHEPVIWYGGKAGVNALKPKSWQKVRVTYIGEGKYDLSDYKTRESVKVCTLANQVFWARVNEDQDQDQEPAAVEETMPPGGYEVPANFLELAEEGNTDAAKKYWKRRCEEYRRTGK